MLVIAALFNVLRLRLNNKLMYIARIIICVCTSHDILFFTEGKKMIYHLLICYFLHSLWYLGVVEIALKLDCIFRDIM